MHLHRLLLLLSFILFILITSGICRRKQRGRGKKTKNENDKKTKTSTSGFKFKEKVEQVYDIASKKHTQTPCRKDNRGNNFCLPYNPSYQADTLVEAIQNFRLPLASETGEGKLLISSKRCKNSDRKCKECERYVFSQLLKQLNKFADISLWNETVKSLAIHFDLTKHRLKKYLILENVDMKKVKKSNCPGLKAFGKRGPKGTSEDKNNNDKTTEVKGRNEDGETSANLGTSGVNMDSKRKQLGNGNVINEYDSQYIDQVLTFECYEKGQPVEKESAFVNLCNFCWKIAVLREDLYPRYIYFMTCDTNNACLAGWGTCRERIRSVQFRKKTTTGYKPQSIGLPLVCDCQVKAGSALHDFVLGE